MDAVGGEVMETLLKKTTKNGGEDQEELGMIEKVWRESKKLWVVAAPAIFTRFSTSGVSLITQAFVGHIGPTELAAYSITLTVLLRFSNGILGSLELWYNSILILLTGHLRNAQVALNALAICININALEMMVAFGFMAAASVRVSNEIGSGNSKGAKFATMIVVLTSLSIGIVVFIVFMCLREKVSYIFTTSEAVAAKVADLSPLLAFSILLNSVQPVLSGVAVGAGWQKYVTYVNLSCYYLVGIPSGLILGYVLGLQVKGVWIGMLFGIFVQTCVLTIMTLRTDWDQQVSTSLKRLNRWVVPESRAVNNTNSSEE